MKILYSIFTFISLYITVLTTINTFFVPHSSLFLTILNIISFCLCLLIFLVSQAIIILIYLGAKDQQNQLVNSLFNTIKVS